MTEGRFFVDATLAALFATLVGALALIAWVSPSPNRVTDRAVYEATAADVIVVDCSDLQCFRILVPWVLGRLPGPSEVRWKAYAVVSNAAAAVGVWVLCATFGSSRRACLFASTISAFGFGSLYTLHDPYTSDPLMYAIGPLITDCLLKERLGIAAFLSVVGVLAKEFAAAPAYALVLYHATARQWQPALRALLVGNAGFLTWAVLTITLMLRFNYGWGWNGVGSANLTGGAALALWAGKQSMRGIAFAMFNEFGALYVLAPAGFLLASRPMRRLAIVSLPLAALFGYVQQPDRALWNFHYLVAPLAALVLERTPAGLAWATVALFAIGNLRVGAQLPIAAAGRVALAGSVLLAVLSTVSALRTRSPSLGPVLPNVIHEAGH
jgi:hypothetical protein